jgi:hypothetical protein
LCAPTRRTSFPVHHIPRCGRTRPPSPCPLLKASGHWISPLSLSFGLWFAIRVHRRGCTPCFALGRVSDLAGRLIIRFWPHLAFCSCKSCSYFGPSRASLISAHGSLLVYAWLLWCGSQRRVSPLSASAALALARLFVVKAVFGHPPSTPLPKLKRSLFHKHDSAML